LTELISIVMPAFNAERFIEEAVSSVLQQTYSSWKLFIIDDCSTDGTGAILRELQTKDARIEIREVLKRVGPGGARNIGLQMAKGKYVAFLDSDDMWAADKLEIQVGAMQEKDAVLSFTGYKRMDVHSRAFGHDILPPRTVSYRQLLRSNVIGCSTAMVDRYAIGTITFPEIEKRQDLGFWLQILKVIEASHRDATTRSEALVSKVLGVRESLCYYRVHEAGISSNKLLAAKYQWRIYREIESLSIWESIYYFFFYALNGIQKYIRR
jgi:teichuronic acid biosynthesis glycosyltransferase TuaG